VRREFCSCRLHRVKKGLAFETVCVKEHLRGSERGAAGVGNEMPRCRGAIHALWKTVKAQYA
jgi:hypothetical protein